MKNKFDEIIGQNIKKVRTKYKLSQTDLANVIDLHQAGISRIESGRQSITLREILKLAKELNLEINDFINGAKL